MDAGRLGRQAPAVHRVMILCAGLGTRLRPLTEELPKPLVPIGDRSILAHTAARLAAAGFSSAIINTHHIPSEFDREISSLPIKIEAIHEPVIRGTAGGVAGARTHLGPAPVLVWNGDILVDPPIEDLLAAAGDWLCLAVAPRERGEGTVGLGSDGQVVRLRGQRFGEEHSGADYVGVAALGARCLAELPDQGCLVGDVALPLLESGGAVRTVPISGRWTDAGDPSSYLEANLDWLAAHAEPGKPWLGPGAQVDSGVRVSSSVIGTAAELRGEGSVVRCVVWPGAVATAPLSDAIVTTGGRVLYLA